MTYIILIKEHPLDGTTLHRSLTGWGSKPAPYLPSSSGDLIAILRLSGFQSAPLYEPVSKSLYATYPQLNTFEINRNEFALSCHHVPELRCRSFRHTRTKDIS